MVKEVHEREELLISEGMNMNYVNVFGRRIL